MRLLSLKYYIVDETCLISSNQFLLLPYIVFRLNDDTTEIARSVFHKCHFLMSLSQVISTRSGPGNPNSRRAYDRDFSFGFETRVKRTNPHMSSAGTSLYAGGNVRTRRSDSGTCFEPVFGSSPFSCSPYDPDGLVTFAFSFLRVPSTRLVHFLPRAPDPRATQWVPPPRVLSSLGLSLTRPEQTRR